VAARALRGALRSIAIIWSLVSATLLVAPTPVPLHGQDDAGAQRLMLSAEQKSRAGDAAGAIADLRSVIERFPSSRVLPTALLTWAQLASANGAPDESVSLLDRLLAQHPTAPEAASARVAKARLQVTAQPTRAGLEATRNLLDRLAGDFDRGRFPDLQARAEGRVLAGELEELLGDLDGAAAHYLVAIEDEPASASQSEARFRLARVLLWQRFEIPVAVPAAVQLLQEAIASPATDAMLVARASALVTLVDRTIIGPERGRKRWTRARTFTTYPLRKPSGVDAAFDGSIAVTDADGLVVFPPTGEPRRHSLVSAQRPSYQSSGRLLVPTTNGVFALPERRLTSLTFARDKPRPLERMLAAAADPVGRVVVLDRTLDGAAFFGADARPIQELAAGSGAVDLAINDRGRTHILVDKSPRVLIFDFDLELAGGVGGQWSRPSALDIDDLGNIYVLDRAERRIDLITPNGQVLDRLGPILPGGFELRAPEDLAVDGQGRLFIVDGRNENVAIVD
jgi:tetratricopeptide (TPR) repeat protein